MVNRIPTDMIEDRVSKQKLSDILGKFVSVPSSSTAAGEKGNWATDGTYLYICSATNVWKRVAIASW